MGQRNHHPAWEHYRAVLHFVLIYNDKITLQCLFLTNSNGCMWKYLIFSPWSAAGLQIRRTNPRYLMHILSEMKISHDKADSRVQIRAIYIVEGIAPKCLWSKHSGIMQLLWSQKKNEQMGFMHTHTHTYRKGEKHTIVFLLFLQIQKASWFSKKHFCCNYFSNEANIIYSV